MGDSKTVTIPRFLYEMLMRDSQLVSHLAHYRGYRWIEVVRKEMESDRKYSQGMFKKRIKVGGGD